MSNPARSAVRVTSPMTQTTPTTTPPGGPGQTSPTMPPTAPTIPQCSAADVACQSEKDHFVDVSLRMGYLATSGLG